MVQAAGLSGHRICTASALEWAFYNQSMQLCRSLDPKIGIPLRQVKAWMRQYQESSRDQQEDIKKQWPKKLIRLKDARTRWMRTKEPMEAAISTMLDIGWRVPHPTKWLAPTGHDKQRSWTSRSTPAYRSIRWHTS